MVYHKTHEGRAALRERGTLTLRERQLMVLFNGSRTLKELADLFGAGVTADVDRLERQGFIVGRPGDADRHAAQRHSGRTAWRLR